MKKILLAAVILAMTDTIPAIAQSKKVQANRPAKPNKTTTTEPAQARKSEVMVTPKTRGNAPQKAVVPTSSANAAEIQPVKTSR